MKISTISELLANFRSMYPGLPEKVYQGATELACQARNELTLSRVLNITNEQQSKQEVAGPSSEDQPGPERN